MGAAAEVEVRSREKTAIAVAKYSELKHWNTDGLGGALQFYFCPCSRASCNRQGVGSREGRHALIGRRARLDGSNVSNRRRGLTWVVQFVSRGAIELEILDSGETWWRA